MKGTKSGFTLVELLVSAAVGYFLLTMLLAAVWVIYNRLAQVRAYNAGCASVAVALDMMAHDFKTLSDERSFYQELTNNCMIWRLPDGNSRGYELAQATLKRLDGHYDGKRHRWQEVTRSVVLQQVKTLVFRQENDADRVRAITVSLAVTSGGQDITMHNYYAVRNRRVRIKL